MVKARVFYCNDCGRNAFLIRQGFLTEEDGGIKIIPEVPSVVMPS